MKTAQKTVDVKLTEKEEKALATVNAFFKGLQACKTDEEEEKYIMDNACSARMILSYGKTKPEDAFLVLASSMIQVIIPYLVAGRDGDVKETAEKLDEITDKMMNETLKKFEAVAEKMKEQQEAESDQKAPNSNLKEKKKEENKK